SQSNKIYLIQPPLLHVPNAFTPNQDGLNELWNLVPVFVKEYHLKVYDRWGSKVFDTEDKHADWDGFIRGVQTANSVYIYTVRYTGWDRSVHYQKGTVTLLK
ncbi:MAG: gliding motility-associated C-terminal domain-containing protein, partial [Bacteroidetes bacterium]|nr:gliding motility-associated C-terminal domain-containing protein [Bacteroidota bacterium]